MSERRVQCKLRLEGHLHAELAEAAQAAGRSLNEEIVRRLERTLTREDMLEEIRDTLGPFLRASLIRNLNGVSKRSCRRCGLTFNVGTGTGRRHTAQFCGPKCQAAHYYEHNMRADTP